jgi:hypothetical protein
MNGLPPVDPDEEMAALNNEYSWQKQVETKRDENSRYRPRNFLGIK